MTIYRAVIPTNSLMLIYEKVGNGLNGNIVYLRATSSMTESSKKTRPHKNIKIHTATSVKAYLKFNRQRTREALNMDDVIEWLRAYDVMDVWVHELKLRFKHGLGPFDFVFKNQAITPGTDAEMYVEKYLNEMRKSGFLKKVSLRHLPLITALSIPQGGNLDRVELESREFVKWLSDKTLGLVKMKTMEKVSQDVYRDVSISDVHGRGF